MTRLNLHAGSFGANLQDSSAFGCNSAPFSFSMPFSARFGAVLGDAARAASFLVALSRQAGALLLGKAGIPEGMIRRLARPIRAKEPQPL